jgi:hypothetical protein
MSTKNLITAYSKSPEKHARELEIIGEILAKRYPDDAEFEKIVGLLAER